MRFSPLVSLVWITLLLSIAPSVYARKFTDASGKVSVEATLPGIRGNLALLKKADGKVFEVPIARLSRPDQEYIASKKLALERESDRKATRSKANGKNNSPGLGASPRAATYHVDGDRGNDRNAGSQRAPWKTLAKVNQKIGSMRPGDAVLFQRGDSWSGKLTIEKVDGKPGKEIVFGAYGPEENPKPSIEGKVTIEQASHIVLRDLEIHGSTGGACVNASFSSYLQVINNDVHDCNSNGIAYHAMVHHTATVDNRVWDIHANDGVSIHDVNWGEDPRPVGSHHWVIDNMFPGNYHEDAIDFATNQIGAFPAGEDVKIMGNRITGAKLAGVVSGHDGRHVWIIGNIISQCGQRGAGAIQSTGRRAMISGNILFNNVRPVSLGTRGLRFRNNTLIQSEGVGLRISSTMRDGVIVCNLVYPLVTHAVVLTGDQPGNLLQKMDYNWFGYPGGQAASRFRVDTTNLHLDKWQAQFGFDANSFSGPLEGVDAPAAAFDPPDAQQGDEFWNHFIPTAGWAGCDTADGVIGAMDCDGNRQGLEILPFADYEENDGYGWAGPVIVQQRYPLPNAEKDGENINGVRP
ncbi:MAG: hypothetical protein GY903_27170 [Fuerstiella sp.]|nr:hypothetical protein [Fuerstiella sp.]MCP4858180.1 hypothetical protein [Fuerstiella sp.]